MSATFSVYITTQNSDLTEGRGGQVEVSYWEDEEKAVLDAKGRGVMGVGDGGVKVRHYTPMDDGSVSVLEEKVYGYRQDPFGKWSHGYVDNREFSDVTQSSEYAEWLRLSKKYGGQ